MEIVIKETGEVEELLLIDSKTGCDWFDDLVGNHDGFNDNPEYGFAKEFDEDGYSTGRFVTSQENFYWWEDLVCKMAALEIRIDNLRNEFGSFEVETVLAEAGSGYGDLENYP